MSKIAQVKEDLKETRNFEFIAKTFTEVNAVKAKNIRVGFEKNRRFFNEIQTVYHLVKVSEAKNKSSKMMGPGRGKNNLAIAITSNLHFYGSLNRLVMEKFVSDQTGKDSELIIIGQTGLDYLTNRDHDLKIQPLRFKKDYPDKEEINFLAQKSQDYDQVHLYYPKFVNMIRQEISVIDITQGVEREENLPVSAKNSLKTKPEKEKQIDIFEPELSKILEFFELQVKTLLLIRTFLETELSRTAARLLSMSGAQQRAQELVKAKKIEYNKVLRSIENAKILETFAGMGSWGWGEKIR